MLPDKFANLICSLDDLSDKQTFQVMLHLRSIETNGANAQMEVMASFNSLGENGVIAVISQIKKQFSDEDWETILEIT